MSMARSRFARHLRKDRFAQLAFLLIGLYGLIAVVLFCFQSSVLELSQTRIGAKNVRGFFLEQSEEKRLEHAEYYLDILDRALKKEDAESALREISFGDLKVKETPVEEIRSAVEQNWAIFDSLFEGDSDNLDPSILTQFEAGVKQLYQEPTGWKGFVRSFQLCLGTDRQGRSISVRATYSILIAIEVGLVTALVSVLVGTLLGTAAGLYGGWVDHAVIWLYTTFSSIPNIVLLVLLVFAFKGSGWEKTLLPVYTAFCVTFWIGPCRVTRAETLKIRELEYIQATRAIGFSQIYTLWRHVWPNVSHLMLINFSLLFIGAIKSEVILSFLGLGVQNSPSWGIMISQSGSEVISGFFWQIGSVTVFMFILVMAFNIVSDFLQDVFDPKHQ